VFRRKRNAPSTPFTHAEDGRILRTDPSVEIPWNYVGGRTRRQSACARPSTSVSPSPTTVFGSTRTTRLPHVISGSASTPRRPIPP
jgi:hypothetical protein